MFTQQGSHAETARSQAGQNIKSIRPTTGEGQTVTRRGANGDPSMAVASFCLGRQTGQASAERVEVLRAFGVSGFERDVVPPM